MLNSGLRVGEARQMRWEDIKFDVLNPSYDREFCVVSVRKKIVQPEVWKLGFGVISHSGIPT
jgi:hypothetical protein